ncbi:hypothetical protein SYNPS1DRAFT_28755 [Syncephalis pseudoplumigaleata]|uniref:Uncharacterized protein n=1 Tax=Syncephalis pseudoplumigaleata TaxID=1712513 RepID=A0A4P9YZB2_9FUNG|nr:hypothetical protein SYNPS1DRAFT_28755 [Syncephalis pseudoplumigaleata]|eukprot:RKP25513.1 hypothetical protein SYNPS1DRAFT_28755 [Syncephalis pseudoplumigaleata]
MAGSEASTFVASADSLAKAFAIEHAIMAICLLIYLAATVIINRCQRCTAYLDSYASVSAHAGPDSTGMAAFPVASRKRPIKQTRPQIVASAAMLACAASLLLRIVPVLYPATSLLDARNVVVAGSDALTFSVNARRPAQVRVIFLLDILADTLLLSAIWLALARQSFTLHNVFRNGGHTLVRGHYWRIFSPMAGWSCVAIAVTAVPCTELVVFLLFDRYITSTLGFQALALPPLLDPSLPASMHASDALELNDNAGAMLTTGTGWALARIMAGIWCAAYTVVGFAIAQATYRRRAEMYSRRNQAIPATQLALSVQNNCRVFVHLFALPAVALLFASVAGVQAGLVLQHASGGYWQLVFSSLSSAVLFFMYLLLIYSLSLNIQPPRPLSTLSSSGMAAIAYGANIPQALRDNRDTLCPQMDEASAHMQQLYPSGISLPPLADAAEAAENSDSITATTRPLSSEQARHTPSTIDSYGLPVATMTDAEQQQQQQQHRQRHVVARNSTERTFTGSIASLIDILPGLPRRFVHSSSLGRRMKSNETIRNPDDSCCADDAVPADKRRRSLSLPSIPMAQPHDSRDEPSTLAAPMPRILCNRLQQRLAKCASDASGEHDQRASAVPSSISAGEHDPRDDTSRPNSHTDRSSYVDSYRYSTASSTSPEHPQQSSPAASSLLHSRNAAANAASMSSLANRRRARTSYYDPSRRHSPVQLRMSPDHAAHHSIEERMPRFKWPSVSSISAMVANAAGFHQRSSLEQLPTFMASARTPNEQASHPCIDAPSPAHLESGRSTPCYAPDDSHAGEDKPLEPFSFVVPPPVQRRVHASNHLSSRSFPSHKYSFSLHTTQQKAPAAHAEQTSRGRQASLPSLHQPPPVETAGHGRDAGSATSSRQGHYDLHHQHHRQALSSSRMNGAMPEQPEHFAARSPTRVTFASRPGGDELAPDSPHPASTSRRRIDLGSYGGLDLGPFGNGGVAEHADEDDAAS